MNGHDAAERARRALQDANVSRMMVGVGSVEDDDHTWADWEQLLLWRVTLAFGTDKRPDMEALELAAGFCLAAMIALDRAEMVDVTTGTAA